MHGRRSQHIQIANNDLRAYCGTLNFEPAVQKRRNSGCIAIHGRRRAHGYKGQMRTFRVDAGGIGHSTASHRNQEFCIPGDGQQHLAAGKIIRQHIAFAVNHAGNHIKASFHERFFHFFTGNTIGIVIRHQHAVRAEAAALNIARNAFDQIPADINILVNGMMLAAAIALHARNIHPAILIIPYRNSHVFIPPVSALFSYSIEPATFFLISPL